MKRYRIELNEKHLRMIQKSLEQYSRMLCGQITERFVPSLEEAIYKECGKDFTKINKIKDEIDEKLNDIKRIIWGLNPNASHGIGYDEKSDFAYDMYKEILYTFEQERKSEEGSKYCSNVHSCKPSSHTKDERIEITPISERKIKFQRLIENVQDDEQKDQ